MIRALCVAMLCLPLLLACGPQGPGSGADVVDDAIEAVSVEPASARVRVGETIELDAVVTVASGAPNSDVNWSSSDDAVAAVDAAGVVTGVSVGSAIVTATSVFDSTVSGSADIGVDADLDPSALASEVSVDPDPPLRVANGVDTVEIGVVVRNAGGVALAGVTVEIEPIAGGATIEPSEGSVVTGADGEALFTLTSTSADTFSYALNAGGVDLGAPIEITFVEELGLIGFGRASAVTGDAINVVGRPTGGLRPFTFARSDDDLPAGVSFDPVDGSISGTTSETGTFSGTVTVTDALGQSANAAYTLEVRRPTPVWHVSGQRDATGTGDSASVGWPEGAMIGDLVVVIVVSQWASTTHTVTGFERIASAGEGSSPKVSAWYKVMGRGDGLSRIAVTFSDEAYHHVVASHVTGHDAADPTGASSTYANGQANGHRVILRGVTVGAGSLLVGAATHFGETRMLVPDSMDEVWSHTGERSLAVAVEERASAGPTGDRHFQGEVAGGRSRAGLMFEIRP